MIRLKNEFHGTATFLRPKNGRVSPEALRRAERRLCGVSGCCCWHSEIHPDDAERWTRVPRADGDLIVAN